MKKCPRCNESKQSDSFCRNHTTKDRLSCYCRACSSTMHKTHYSTTRGLLAQRWGNIMARCYNPAHRMYADYGGRGIVTCERWRDKERFIADILSLIGPPPSGMSLDRIDNDAGYREGNVRWATSSQQNGNRRAHSTNTSGAIGVSRHGSRWEARVMRERKQYFIGIFNTVAEAAAARAGFLLCRES